MTIITDTVLDAAGLPVARAAVMLRLVGEQTRTILGYATATDSTVSTIATVITDTNGVWTADVVANAAITPAGSVYEVSVLKSNALPAYIDVPDVAGPLWVGDLLVDPPGVIPSAALGEHIARTTDVHGIADTALLVDDATLAAAFEDPLGFGYPTNALAGTAYAPFGTANVTTYGALYSGGYTMSKLRVQVATAAGNITVAAYSRTGAALTARPGNRLATSGSVPCPSAGTADVSLGASITPARNDFFADARDNTTASLALAATINGNVPTGVTIPRYYVESIYPPPAVAAPVTSGNNPVGTHRHAYLVGVA